MDFKTKLDALKNKSQELAQTAGKIAKDTAEIGKLNFKIKENCITIILHWFYMLNFWYRTIFVKEN